MNRTKIQKFPPQHKEELIYIEAGRALEKAAHGGHVVSLSGDI